MLASTLVLQCANTIDRRVCRSVPRDECPRAAIEKRSADGLDVGEVKARAAGDFQRFGDLVVNLLRVDTRAHPTAIIA